MTKESIILLIIFSSAMLISAIIGVVTILSSRRKIEKAFDVENLKKYEKSVQEFIDKNKINKGEDVESIVKRIGYEVVLTSNIPFLVDACITGDSRIEVQKRFSINKRKFIIAHEIAHIINGDVATARKKERLFFSSPISEQICDYMAAAILVPAEDLRDKMIEKKYLELDKIKQDEFIQEIANEMDLQKDVIIRRVSEVKKLYAL